MLQLVQYFLRAGVYFRLRETPEQEEGCNSCASPVSCPALSYTEGGTWSWKSRNFLMVIILTGPNRQDYREASGDMPQLHVP